MPADTLPKVTLERAVCGAVGIAGTWSLLHRDVRSSSQIRVTPPTAELAGSVVLDLDGDPDRFDQDRIEAWAAEGACAWLFDPPWHPMGLSFLWSTTLEGTDHA